MNDLKRGIPANPNQEVRFTVDVAPSVNHMYIFGKGTKCLTKEAKAYIERTQHICLEAMQACQWKKDNENVWYHMDLQFYFPDKRIRDSHNCLKILMDSLEGVLFDNDYFVMPRIQHVGYDKEHPRIEISFKAE